MNFGKIDRLVTLKNVILLGIIVCLATTLYDVMTGKQWNFLIFQLSTIDFWNGVMPYGEQWFSHGLDYYLYSPIFNILFTPFAYAPDPIGLFLWNLFNFALLGYAICSVPKIDLKQKAYTILFLIPILIPAQMSCQYNLAVGAMFILGFTLMEKNRPALAILLIMISGMTKIYGIAELAILLFYPRFWRNVVYALLFAVILAALPLIKLSFAQYGHYISGWLGSFAAHKASRPWETIYDISIIPWADMRYVLMSYIQVGVFAVGGLLILWRRRLWSHFNFRLGVVASIMGWCILFGNSSETHTYLISVLGFLIYHHSTCPHSTLDRWVYWVVFVVIALMPIDLIFPAIALDFAYHTLHLNKFLMLFVWIYILTYTLSIKSYNKIELNR